MPSHVLLPVHQYLDQNIKLMSHLQSELLSVGVDLTQKITIEVSEKRRVDYVIHYQGSEGEAEEANRPIDGR